ncbi:MAG: DNA-3-methyladenine glycosylase I [Propioniciclava sp.]
MSTDIRHGPDSRPRCGWVGEDETYRRYHDEEWGYPLHGDRNLFEKLALEGFQAGLSWITILRKREAFRAAFANFQPELVAAFGPEDVARLLADTGIVRNRLKIEATITNAQLMGVLEPGELESLIWSFAPEQSRRVATLSEVPAVTPASTALSVALRARGFRFVGPTTMYALMQSAGLVDDHLAGCWRATDSSGRVEPC